MEATGVTLAANVRDAVKASRITQQTLAKRVGIARESVGRKLRGEREWTATELVLVARAIGTDMAKLVGDA